MFRFFGIQVRVHLFLVLFVAAMVASAFVHGTAAAGWHALSFYGLLVASVFFHELGHCAASAHYGGTPKEILLWLLGGLAHVEDTPHRPGPQMVIALAGPAVNLLLAGAALATLLALGLSLAPLLPGSGPFRAESVLRHALAVNGVLFLFNLLPALPLDGGSFLRWALAERRGLAGATYATALLGQVLAVLLGLAALVFRVDMLFFVLFVALFLFLEAERQKRLARDVESASFVFWTPGETEFGAPRPEEPRKPSFLERRRARREARKREQDIRSQVETRERVDELLEKISRHGYGSLSEREKTFLQKASRIYGNRKNG